MIGDVKLPIAVFNRLAVLGKFQTVVSLCHEFRSVPFRTEVKHEANTLKLGGAIGGVQRLWGERGGAFRFAGRGDKKRGSAVAGGFDRRRFFPCSLVVL